MKNIEHIEIADAYEAYKQAGLNLMAEVKKRYPVGSLIQFYAGRHETPINMEVTGYSCSWHWEPARIYGKNTKTGKTRHVSAIDESANIVTYRTPCNKPAGKEVAK